MRVFLAVTRAVDRVVSFLNDSERTGGYFCYASRGSMPFVPEVVMRVGNIRNPEKASRYFRLTQEKTMRLGEYARNGHVSSWQSRDSQSDKWGGAILTPRSIFSFSGLPEEADETAMLLAAATLRELTDRQAEKIAAISDNKFFWRICGRFSL